jgi:hypothetical protein
MNPATGAVRWTLSLGTAVIGYRTEVLAAGGVLAFVQDGAIKAVDLTTGKPLWSRPFGQRSPAVEEGTQLTAAGPVVVALSGLVAKAGGTLSGFAAATGKVLWTRPGMPQGPVLASGDGVVLIYNTFGGDPEPKAFPLTGLAPATGKTLWQVATDGLGRGVWSGPGGIVFSTRGRLYLVDPVKGLRWSVPGFALDALVTASDVIYLQWVPGPVPNTQLTDVFDRRLSGGGERWTRTDGALGLALPSGPDFLLLEASSGVDARTLAAGVLTGTVKAPASFGQYFESAVVDGGSTLIEANPFVCVSAG